MNLFALTLSASCVQQFVNLTSNYYLNYTAILEKWNFKSFGGIYRGYVNILSLGAFVQSFVNISLLNECWLDIDRAIEYQTQSCSLEQTNNLSYVYNNNFISLPNAWNLDQNDFQVDYSYLYHNISNDKNNVNIWILDTGINWRHLEFESGQVIDVDSTYDVKNLSATHGTGTSCCAGGLNYGISKHFTIYNYPVCRYGGSCGSGDVDKGLLTVLNYLQIQNPNSNSSNRNWNVRSVINLSIGSNYGIPLINTSIGLYYDSLFKAIQEAGGIITVAAGNSNQDACNWLFSFSPHVISVGALNSQYAKSSFSNWGECVDIWYFGESIRTAYTIKDNTSISSVAGTSFSSPLVGGMVANLLSHNSKLIQEDILSYLSVPYNTSVGLLNVASYICSNFIDVPNCCRGRILNTRQDSYCKIQSVKSCPIRSCIISMCL